MGKVAKKVVEKQKADSERTAKLIRDLLAYIDGMNQCIKDLVDAMNEMNVILKADIEDYKERKDAVVQ